MRICDASGNGVCINCNHTPPKINGYSCGDVCRKTVQDVINAIEDGFVVIYNEDKDKFLYQELWDGDTFDRKEIDWIEI